MDDDDDDDITSEGDQTIWNANANNTNVEGKLHPAFTNFANNNAVQKPGKYNSLKDKDDQVVVTLLALNSVSPHLQNLNSEIKTKNHGT